MKTSLLKWTKTVVLFLAGTITIAQTPLNEVSDFGFNQQNPFSIIELESGDVVIAGHVLPMGEPLNRESFFARYTKNFSYISHTVLHEPDDYQTLTNNCREMFEFNDKLYVSHFEDSFHPTNTQLSFGFIAEYDLESSQVDYLYKVQDTLNDFISVLPSSLLLNEAKELVLVLTNQETDIWIQVIDPSTGKGLRQIQHNDEDYNVFGEEIIETTDGYILIGRKFGSGGYVRAVVWMLDKDFEIISSVTLDETYNHLYVEAILDSDENLVFLTTQHLGDQRFWRTMAIKMDPELNVLWESPIGSSEYSSTFSYLTEVVESHNEDGYIFCGIDEENTSESFKRGTISKMSKAGDSLWYRTFQPLEEQHQANSSLFQIKASTDGNYILTGRASNPSSQDSIISRVWLLKINEEGQVVVSDNTSVSRVESDNIRIFPNPTTDMLYIEQDEVSNITYELYNSSGELLLKREDTASYHTYMLSLQNYASGIYYLHIINDQGKRTVDEIVLIE